ncbi:Prefoldin beta-like protein [Cylindrobasidium torrendii FP15055 ss-10]|uniref:Prefoldin beta-like protein n=1 Tax=Cylindrobasidium torrendii FP15055 ss-10 TaxID=1314674 RepID=A0A0D7BGU8_9AGAR|nr:Prefoldin beta-like protein [Cylindrobasidium torrendii FP15055 ss-10]
MASKGKKQLNNQEIQTLFNQYNKDLQAIASKIGELESEADEHGLVLTTLNETLEKDPDRKCFRLINGVLVERTVKDVVPALNTNKTGIQQIVSTLTEQYKSKEKEFEGFKETYKIQPVSM